MDIEAGVRFGDSTFAWIPAAPNSCPPRAEAAENPQPRGRSIARLVLQIAVVQVRAATAAHDHAQILETAQKIGIWATGICIAGFISVLMGSSGFQANSLVELVLAVACMLAMLASCISGGALLILATFHPHPHPPISSIRIIIAVTIASMSIIVCTGFALKLCKI